MVVKDILRKMRIMENENEILKSLASGDQQVFSWLFRRYYLKVRSFAYGFVKDADEADDLWHKLYLSKSGISTKSFRVSRISMRIYIH